MEFSLEHRFTIPRSIYVEEIYFNDGLADRMQVALELGKKQLIEEEDNELILRRVHLVRPEKDLPRPIKKLFGKKGLGYFETTTYYKGENRLDWSMKTEMMPERVYGGGEILILEDGEHVLRRVTGTITASIFGVGGIIEKTSIEGIRESHDKAAEVTRAWIREFHSP